MTTDKPATPPATCAELLDALERSARPLSTRRGKVVIVDDVPAKRSILRKTTANRKDR